METKPFDKARFKHIAGDGVAEDFNYMPRSNLGMRKWEIKVRYPDGKCKVVVMRDSGFSITGEVIDVNEFTSASSATRRFTVCTTNMLYRRYF